VTTTSNDRPGWADRGARWAFLLAVVCALSACAGSRAYRAGNELLAAGDLKGGIAKLEEAVQHEPTNAGYRIALASRRANLVTRAVAAGDLALRESRLDDADEGYRLALSLDARHAMARQGLDAVLAERRHTAVLAEVDALVKRGGASELVEASERIRGVLVANPQHRLALKLKQDIDQAQAATMRPETRLAAEYKKPITLEFRDAPLKAVFDLIAKLSGLNFFFDKDVRSDVRTTILARNTSIDEAVRLVLVSNQLEQKVLNGNSVLIYPATPAKLKEYQTLVVRTFHVVNADVKALANTIKTIVKTKDIVYDERIGVLMLRDTLPAVRMAERVVALMDATDPEVTLEVEVLEVKRSRLLELGVQWPSQMTLAPLQPKDTSLTLASLKGLNASTTQVSLGNMVINARKEDQDSNILANPRIRVRNKEKAKILIGDKVPVITSTSTATGFNAESVSYIDVGLKLDVEPTVYLDDEVAIKVNLEVSNLVREVVSKSGALSYQIGTRGASTVLRLKDGETQILAGLISDEDRSTANKVPGVGELPLLGRLFGSQKDDTQRNEILLSITPRVVRALRRPDFALLEFESGTENSIGAESLRLTPLSGGATDGARPVGTARGTEVPTLGGQVSLSWQAPSSVKVGEQFNAVLNVGSEQGLTAMPVLLGFDPQYWQIMGVMEGAFFNQAGGAAMFSPQIDAARGRVVAAASRVARPDGAAAGATGRGALLTVSLRAIKAAVGGAKLELLSAAPEPAPGGTLMLPLEHLVRIEP
jgi:general secretion pathway protein D